MSISYIGVASDFLQGSSTTVSCDETLTIVAGDLLVGIVIWEDTNTTIQQIDDTASGNIMTTLDVASYGNGYIQMGYLLSATDAGSKTFRVTLNAAAGYKAIFVFQFRASSAVSLYSGPSSASGAGTTSQTATFSTGGANSLVVAGVKLYWSTTVFSNALIGEEAADGVVTEDAGSFNEGAGWYKLLGQVSDIHAQIDNSASGKDWVCQAISFKEEEATPDTRDLDIYSNMTLWGRSENYG